MTPREYILSIFSSKTTLPTGPAELNSLNYLENGVLDSFGIVKLVSDVEEKFAIRFTHEQMTSAEFRTIGGIITMIESLVNQKG